MNSMNNTIDLVVLRWGKIDSGRVEYRLLAVVRRRGAFPQAHHIPASVLGYGRGLGDIQFK